MGQSIPLVYGIERMARQPTASSINDRANEADILAGHFQPTVIVPPLLKVSFLCCTIEFSYQQEKSEAIGIIKSINTERIRRAASDRTRFAASSCI
ncbi:hypothetical protein IVB11_27430 [Bradyrhizobium sp. 177]|uniref:hypothetical protein n=1 Tax=Bradyrhizobium sp. 177 TaxID=2782647 RepID=UPI001FF8BCE0|nr:hypothetical protein [Bradyrhizobium sp. 177]MCK1552681.1 hypothetical protein [Bradyrhizobium sp. 177]